MNVNEMSASQIIGQLNMMFDWKRRPHEGKFLQRAIELLKEQDETIKKLYKILDDTCKEVREKTEQDYVCGLCQYDGAYKTDTGEWANECPGFDERDCFCMKNKIREMCGVELLP